MANERKEMGNRQERVRKLEDEYRRLECRPELLARAKRCWDAMAAFRRERERCKRFTYGDQWGDLMPTDTGMVREEDYIRAQGNLPLKNNLIRRLVRNVLGVFRNNWTMPRCVARDGAEAPQAALMQRLLAYAADLNHLEEMHARTLEEFLISGMAVHRKWFGRKGSRTDCWTDFVNPSAFFCDWRARDFRGWDTGIVGQIHDMGFDELTATFAGPGLSAETLARVYAGAGDDGLAALRAFGAMNGEPTGFLAPPEAGTCRVIEVWTRSFATQVRCHDPLRGRYFVTDERGAKRMERINALRARRHPDMEPSRRDIVMRSVTAETWSYAFLAPTGHVLRAGVSPYRHGRHPYVVKAYPFVDGEVHSFVSDIIDQQKFTNRLISMYDWILRASAKGVLLFPEEALPAGVDVSDIADEWSRFNGVIVFRPRPGTPLPQQVSSNCSNIGITELLSIQMKMMEDISGVNGALQGKLDNTSMSGTLYNQQTRNSMTALTDLLRCYADFVLEGVATDASNIRQYYSARRITSVTGLPAPADSAPFFDVRSDFAFRLAPAAV